MIKALPLLSLLVLLSCAQRGHVTLDPDAAAIGDVEKIFIGTTRAKQPDGIFGGNRSETEQFALYEVSVPPDRELGRITWPPRHGSADPQVDFITTAEQNFATTDAFRAQLKHQLALDGGEAVIFVHGFNTNFAEGVYRVAQLAHDLKLPGTVVEYSWPSAGKPLAYAYDRDSAQFARGGLEDLIHEVARAGAKRIILLSHSMGTGVVMEALRSTALRGDTRTLALIKGVILISPDLDVDVFREEAHAIGTLPQPFVIVGSDHDRVLQLSAALTGQKNRLGSLDDVNRVSDLKVTFLDVGEFAKGAGHFVLGDSASLIALMNGITQVQGAFEAERRARVGLLPGLVLTVQNATQIVLSPLAGASP